MTTVYERPSKKSREKIVEYLHGDCLEGAGLFIPNGGIAVIDCTLTPRVGDFVICGKHRDTLDRYCKQVKSIGECVVVGTAYLDRAKDFTFEAQVVSGVVVQVFDRLFHSLCYERPIEAITCEGRDG
ncbi:MAG: hypothetical protein E7663_04800 [Ruminococcaceae bacterium]|nr:hypothetical protein [Oscillospiraceae bacterium]